MNYFIITIDTEGDNLWQWKEGDKITTKNSKYIKRFQDLSNKYNFKPTWLCNYEMLNDNHLTDFLKDEFQKNNCGIGTHLHPWNTPPLYSIAGNENVAPFVTEYPLEIIEEKIKTINDLFFSKFNFLPLCHRAGRYTTNNEYLGILTKHGYLCDCSYTPYTSWLKTPGRSHLSKGSDYSKIRNNQYVIDNDYGKIIELPLTIYKKHVFIKENVSTPIALAKEMYHALQKRSLWLRPNGYNLNEMKWLVDNCECEYIMFMLHSSELMPGGSNNFKTEEDIEKLYRDIEELFAYISQKRFVGITIDNYIKVIKTNDNF